MSMQGDASAAKSLSDLIEGFWTTQVLGTAVALGITDELADGPRPHTDIAYSVEADPGCVLRVLRALQSLGVCRSARDASFELTAKGRLLCADTPGSMRGRALFASGMLWNLFGDLATVIRTGLPTRQQPTGRDGFNQLAANPGLAAMHQAMVESSISAVAAAADACDFGNYPRVLDVGGGYGGALTALLQRNPKMTGDVFDLGYLSRDASKYLSSAGLDQRARFIGGDFFETVPSGYDCYLLKYIVHDWDDAAAVQILRVCAAAARPTGTVVLLERVLPERITEDDRAIMEVDIAMMIAGGRERTTEEYRDLLHRAGLRLLCVTPTSSPCSVIHAVVEA